MDGPPTEPERVPTPDGGGGPRRRRRIVVPLVVAGALVAVSGIFINASPTHQSESPAGATPTAYPAPRVAVVDNTGILTTMDGTGGSVVSHAVPGVVFGFPTWSPDGSRLAAVGSSLGDSAIYVFDLQRGRPAEATGSGGTSTDPVVIYRSPAHPPFYLYWTPGGQSVAFLATESDGISLRLAPADGSGPLDGSGPQAVIRRGAPLYFDWEGVDRLLLHVGSGSAAFMGEVGLDGAPVAPAISGTGDFRAASASRDGRYLAYVRTETDRSAIITTARDGSGEQRLPVYGSAAFVFDPTGDSLASIAATEPTNDPTPFPLGPLRLLDPRSGAVRTLLNGSVIGFFWSPDGKTIAALRLARPGDQVAGSGPVITVAMARPAVATPPPGAELRLAFVDVSTANVRSEGPIQLASQFVSELLPYFDQYALSHRLWSPDSATILLPLVDGTGRTQLVSVPADGSERRPVADGISGFWSP